MLPMIYTHNSHGIKIREGVSAITESKVRAKKPSMFRVLLHNDDFTPMDFVVDVLQVIFLKNKTEATKIMLDVHQKGMGLCGIYPYDIAETKVTLVSEEAQKNEYPLKCTLEKD